MKLKHLGMATALATVILAGQASAQDDAIYGSPELIEAAKKEGSMVLYSALILETEEGMVKAFNERFPDIRVEIVRAPGGALLTRINTEAAAGNLAADVIDISDPESIRALEDKLFADYQPANGADYPELSHSKNLWPRSANLFCIAYNTALVEEAPKNWPDLTKPEFKDKTGMLPMPAIGSGWLMAMFERQTFGIEHWEKLAANNPRYFNSGGPMVSAIIQGEVTAGVTVANVVLPHKQAGAPVDCAPGNPNAVNINAAGVTKTAKSPNAARVFMNWSLSPEGQAANVKLSLVSLLKDAPQLFDTGPDQKPVWIIDWAESKKVRDEWTADWRRIFNYRE